MELTPQTFHANAGICRACEHRRLPIGGVMPCSISRNDTYDHCAASYCPLAKFGDRIKPADWQARTVDLSNYGAPRVDPPLTPVPRDDWPLHIKFIATFYSSSDDIGIGSAIERNAGKFPEWIVDAMKEFKMLITGEKTCNCPADRDRLNQLYPLR